MQNWEKQPREKRTVDGGTGQDRLPEAAVTYSPRTSVVHVHAGYLPISGLPALLRTRTQGDGAAQTCNIASLTREREPEPYGTWSQLVNLQIGKPHNSHLPKAMLRGDWAQFSRNYELPPLGQPYLKVITESTIRRRPNKRTVILYYSLNQPTESNKWESPGPMKEHKEDVIRN